MKACSVWLRTMGTHELRSGLGRVQKSSAHMRNDITSTHTGLHPLPMQQQSLQHAAPRYNTRQNTNTSENKEAHRLLSMTQQARCGAWLIDSAKNARACRQRHTTAKHTGSITMHVNKARAHHKHLRDAKHAPTGTANIAPRHNQQHPLLSCCFVRTIVQSNSTYPANQPAIMRKGRPKIRHHLSLHCLLHARTRVACSPETTHEQSSKRMLK